MRLRFTGRAEKQLAGIANHIRRDSPSAALRVVSEIKSAAHLLAEFPEIGRPGSVPRTREWITQGWPYVLIYRIDLAADELVVVQVIHGARRRSQG